MRDLGKQVDRDLGTASLLGMNLKVTNLLSQQVPLVKLCHLIMMFRLCYITLQMFCHAAMYDYINSAIIMCIKAERVDD